MRRKNRTPAKTSPVQIVRSISRTSLRRDVTSPYLSLYVLSKQLERLEKELCVIEKRRKSIRKKLDEIRGKMEKLGGKTPRRLNSRRSSISEKSENKWKTIRLNY